MGRKKEFDAMAGLLILYMMFGHALWFFNLSDSHVAVITQYLFGFFMPWFFFKGGMFFRHEETSKIVMGGVKG